MVLEVISTPLLCIKLESHFCFGTRSALMVTPQNVTPFYFSYSRDLQIRLVRLGLSILARMHNEKGELDFLYVGKMQASEVVVKRR